MKIKRFTAKNMREAIRLVREEQGPDAVILSNRRTPDGIEVVAATDYDAALVQQALRNDTRSQTIVVPAPEKPLPRPDKLTAESRLPVVPAAAEKPLLSKILRAPSLTPSPKLDFSALLAEPAVAEITTPEPVLPAKAGMQTASADEPQRQDAHPQPAEVPVGRGTNEVSKLVAAIPPPAAIEPPKAAAPEPINPVEPKSDTRSNLVTRELADELKDMRHLLEAQLGGLAWEQMKTRQPRHAHALRTLMQMSLAPKLAREIIDELPPKATEAHAHFMPLGALAKRIPAIQKDLIMDGGVFALIGATGVGKTTTIAKLAARYAERHGVRDIALVTTDHYRVGAQEQLFTYGRLLGVPVHTAANAEELARILFKLADRKLVLVDTAGLSPRDRQLQAQFAELHGTRSPMRVLLTLSACQQAGDLEEIVRRFKPAKPEGLILTKLDEATRIGGALSTAIRHRLPVGYIADGQRVPEDLHLTRADQLVLRAMQLTRQNPALPQDGTLALQYGVLNAGS